MISFAFINYQLYQVLEEGWHQFLRDRRRELHRWTLIDLEEPKFAIFVWEQIESINSDSTLSPFYFVPSRENALINDFFCLWVILRIPNLFTILKILLTFFCFALHIISYFLS